MLASDIMYHRAKEWTNAPSSTGCEGGSQAHTNSDDSSSECHCCSSDPCSDNSRMNQFLNDVMPPLYRAQFELPVTAEDKYSCMEMGQHYLILALGGKMGASKSRQDSSTPQTLPAEKEGHQTPGSHQTPAGENDVGPCATSGDDASVPAWLASSLNVDLSISEEMLRKNPDVLVKLSGIMNEMACNRINQAQEDCIATPDHCPALLADLALERKRLELAAYFFQQIGDVQNVAVTHTNLAKYHRVASYFMPERSRGDCYGAAEDEHYGMAVTNYRAALRCLDEQAAARHRQHMHQQQQHKHQQQQHRKNKKRPAKAAGDPSSSSRGDGGEGTSLRHQHREAESLENDELRNNILMNEATTLLQQAAMIMERPPPPTEEGAARTLSNALTVLQQCYDSLQCMPQGYNTQQCIDKSIACCQKLAALYCSANPPGGGQCDVAASVSWCEKQCLLLASTARHGEALQAVVEHCQRLLHPSLEGDKGGDGEVLALQSLRLLVHSEYLVVGVTGPAPLPDKDLLLDCLSHLKAALKRLCQMTTAARASGSSSLVSVDAVKKAFLEALQVQPDEQRLGQRLTVLLQSVGRCLGIDSAAGPRLQL